MNCIRQALLALALALASGISGGASTSSADPPKTWTVMFYVAADTNLELDYIQEVQWLRGVHLPANVAHVIVLFDGKGDTSSDPVLAEAPKKGKNAWLHLTPTAAPGTAAVTVERYPSADVPPGEPNTRLISTLRRLLDRGLAQATDHYALVMKGHGNGILGMCENVTPSGYEMDGMPVSAMHKALKGFRDGWTDSTAVQHPGRPGNKNLEVLFLDSCYMSHLEVLLPPFDANAGTPEPLDVDVVVASEDILLSMATCFASVLESINDATTADTLAPRFIDRYLLAASSANAIPACQTVDGSHPQTALLAAFRQPALVHVRTHLEDLAEELTLKLTATETPLVGQARNATEGYGEHLPNAQPNSVTLIHRDLGDFCQRLLAIFPAASTTNAPLRTAAQGVYDAIEAARLNVINPTTEHPRGRGLSVHFPTNGIGYEPYSSMGGQKWRHFLSEFQKMAAQYPAACPCDTAVASPAVIDPEHPSLAVQAEVRAAALPVTSGVYFAVGAPGETTAYLGSMPVTPLAPVLLRDKLPATPSGGVVVSRPFDGSWPRLVSGEKGEKGEKWIPLPVRHARPMMDGTPGYFIDAPVLRSSNHGKGPVERIVLHVEFAPVSADSPDIVGHVRYAFTDGPGTPRQARLEPGDRITGVYQSGFNGSNADVDLPIPEFGTLDVGADGTLAAGWGPLRDGNWSVLLYTLDLVGTAHASGPPFGVEIKIALGKAKKGTPGVKPTDPVVPKPGTPDKEKVKEPTGMDSDPIPK